MAGRKSKSLLRRFFRIGIVIKGFDGLLETIGGLLFLFISKQALNGFVILLTQHELNEDPGDLIANSLRNAAVRLSPATKSFGGIYLLGHGLIKVFLAVELLRCRLWSYPVAIAFLCAFVGYQVYRLSYHFTFGLLLLTCFDVVIVFLIWREFQQLRQERQVAGAYGHADR